MLPAIFWSLWILTCRRCGENVNNGEDSHLIRLTPTLATDAANSIAFALSDSKSCLEIDFPKPLPVQPQLFCLVFCWILCGPWQVMLKQTDGLYACVAESPILFHAG